MEGFAYGLGPILVLQEGFPREHIQYPERQVLSSQPQLHLLGHPSLEATGWQLLIWFPILPRICFPVQVNRLPRETLLCATLYALPIPLPGSSSEANKQRRVPEALGWVTTPLFNFRQYVVPRAAASWPWEAGEGVGGGGGGG